MLIRMKNSSNMTCFTMHIIQPGLSGPRDYLPRWLGHSTVQPNWPRSAGHGGHVAGSPFQDLFSSYYDVHVQMKSHLPQNGKITATITETGPNNKRETTGNLDVLYWFAPLKIRELRGSELGSWQSSLILFAFCPPAFPEGDSSPVWQLPWQADPQGLPD